MRIVRSVLVFSLACLTAGCFGNSIRGSGNVVTESREVSGFTGVEVSGSARLVVEQGDTESLSITADDNLMQYLTSEVQGSTLMLGTKNFASLSPTDAIVYKLSVRNLDRLGISGSVEADVRGIRTDSLTVGVSGSGKITVSGEADAQEINVSGSAEYEAEDFKTKDASINISGSAKAVVAVSDNLDVRVSGSGDVEYIGNPEITKSISGAGNIRSRS